MNEDKRPAAAAAFPLGDGNRSDSQVADVLISGFPIELRALIGADLREIVKLAIRRERARAAGLVQRVAALQARKANGIGDEGLFADYGARVLMAVSKMILDPPGACGRCGGARRVPAGLAGPDGQPLMSDCPTCAGTPESSIAAVVEISSAKPSDPG